MMRRSFIALGLFAASVAHAGSLTEADVIRLAREHDSVLAIEQARAVLARASETGAGLYPNPTAFYQREDLSDPADLRQLDQLFLLSVPLELPMRRSANRALAAAETAWAEADSRRARSAAVHDALSLFYEVIAATERVRIHEVTVSKLGEAARVIATRQQAGTASGYDGTRFALE